MHAYQREFLAFAIERGVLRFGDFTLKSGRRSPYFFNSGLFNSGASLALLGRYYAAAIVQAGLEFDMLFGPAYKGIPLVAALGIAFADQHDRDVPYAFNRKEAKDHGEGGVVVGAPLAGRVLIVDDVISAGTSARESLALIRAHDATPAAVAISLDRQERGQGGGSAIDELQRGEGLPVVAIITLDHVLTYIQERGDMQDSVGRIRAYRERYGV